MTIGKHITTFAGLPVKKVRATMDPPDDPGGYAWRLTTNYDGGSSRFKKRFDALVNADWVGQVTAIVVGDWGDANDDGPPLDRFDRGGRPVDRTAGAVPRRDDRRGERDLLDPPDRRDAAARRLPAAGGAAGARRRGPGDQPGCSTSRCGSWRSRPAGCRSRWSAAIGESDLPALAHLELWLGTDNYGGDVTVEDLSADPVRRARCPRLTYLGLRDAEIADQVADALAGAPVVARLSTLDLSLGHARPTSARPRCWPASR